MLTNDGEGRDAGGGAVSQETPADVEARAREFLKTLLGLMGAEGDIQAGAEGDGSRINLEITGCDGGFIIGRHGQMLDALEYLTNRIATHGPGSPRVQLDAEGYRLRRAESLEDLARSLAQRARESGRPTPSGPLNARERRIIHMALQDEPDVTTESEGNDPYRRVVVYVSRIRPKQ